MHTAVIDMATSLYQRVHVTWRATTCSVQWL